MTKIGVAAAVNDREVLQKCLLSSPDIASEVVTVRTYERYKNSGLAYNRALSDSESDYLIFAHQDVFLPKGSLKRIELALDHLDATQPNWAVAGVIGVDSDGRLIGRTWSSGLKMVIGHGGNLPAQVESLDELLIIIRTQAGLVFDEALPSFHLYGTDIVQIAKQAGRSSWVIDLPVIHFSRPVTNLGGGYRDAWKYMQTKWRSALPIPNLVCPIGRSILPLLKRDLRLRIKFRGKSVRTQPPGCPQDIASRLGWDS